MKIIEQFKKWWSTRADRPRLRRKRYNLPNYGEVDILEFSGALTEEKIARIKHLWAFTHRGIANEHKAEAS